MDESDLRNQRVLFHIHIISSMFITIGGILFGIASALFMTNKVIVNTEDPTELLMNLVLSQYVDGLSLLIAGIVILFAGWLVPLILFNYFIVKNSR